MSDKKEKWAIVAHPNFLRNKVITLMSSPYVKKDEPVWMNLDALKVEEPRKMPNGVAATKPTVATKVQDLKLEK